MIGYTLSANTLFHFTNNLENIKNILTHGFYPHYCQENLSIFLPDKLNIQENYEYAIPLISFCDIPLSQIKNHIDIYGKYAIGLSKYWGQREKINPVMYALPNSFATNALKNIIENSFFPNNVASSIDNILKDNLKSNYLNSSNLYYYINYLKPYEGKLWRNNAYLEQVIRFYDEREWRYVPELSDNLASFLSKTEFSNPSIRKKNNDLLKKHCMLSFEAKDINYIIVDRESEIVPILDLIDYIKKFRPYEDTRLLASKLISIEQLMEDF